MTNAKSHYRIWKRTLCYPMKSPSTVKRSTKFKEMVQAELEKNAALPEPRPEKDIYKEMFIIECKKPLLAWTEYQKRLPLKKKSPLVQYKS